MGRPRKKYFINVHYPASQEEILKMRIKTGEVYHDFIQEYILGLSINDQEKNKLYKRVFQSLSDFDRKKPEVEV